MPTDWGDYAHPRPGCLPVVLMVVLLVVLGCASVKTWEAQQLLSQYGCHYCQGEAGFCCEKAVPEDKHWIFNCIYGKELVNETK